MILTLSKLAIPIVILNYCACVCFPLINISDHSIHQTFLTFLTFLLHGVFDSSPENVCVFDSSPDISDI